MAAVGSDGPHGALRRAHRGTGRVVHRRRRRRHRCARAERGRQDEHDRGVRGLSPCGCRHRAGAGDGPREGATSPQRAHRRDAAGGRRVPRSACAGDRTPLLRALRQGRGRRGPGGAGGAHRAGQGHLASAVRRREAAAVAGVGPGGQTRGRLSRRAHRRGGRQRAGHHPRHHPLPGRGWLRRGARDPRTGRSGAAGGSGGHLRRRPGDRRRHAGRPASRARRDPLPQQPRPGRARAGPGHRWWPAASGPTSTSSTPRRCPS